MNSALVLYHSQEYGNTDAMAVAVGEGARSASPNRTLGKLEISHVK
jgi:flavorubredoxin